MSLGSILVAFEAPGQGSGLLWELLGAGVRFCHVSGKSRTCFWTPFWHPKSKKSQNNTTKQCPGSSLEKVRFQNISKTVNFRFYIVITICLERSDIFNLEVFWYPFGSLLESLFDTFGKQVGFGTSKTGVSKKHQKLMRKGHASTTVIWWPAPKEILFKRDYPNDTIQMIPRRTSYSKVPEGTVADIYIYIYIYIYMMQTYLI